MVEEEDILLNPVVAGWLSAESLLDGSVDLQYVMWLNEALDVRQENERRREAARASK